MPGKTYMLHIDNMRYETNKYYLNFRRNPLVLLNKINCCKCILRSVHITFFCKSSKRLREYSCNTISEQKVQIKNLRYRGAIFLYTWHWKGAGLAEHHTISASTWPSPPNQVSSTSNVFRCSTINFVGAKLSVKVWEFM